MNRGAKYLALTELARHRHFGRAAEALGISQPALSRRIQALETWVGEPLVIRGNGEARLTQFGEIIVRRAERIVEQLARMESKVRRVQQLKEGRVRLGGGPYPTVLMVPQVLGAIGWRYPNLSVAYETEGWRLVTQRLKQQKLDLAITDGVDAERDQELKVFWLKRRTMRAVIRRNHPLDGAGEIDAATLARFPAATTSLPPRVLTRIREEFGAGWRPSLLCDDVRLLMDYCRGTDALIFLPERLLEPGLVAVATAVRIPGARWGVIRRAAQSPSPAAQAVIETVLQVDAKL